MAQATPEVNPSYLQWKNPEMLAFLSAQKGGVAPGTSILDASNVMEYFSTSPFYDRHSNNEHVRMQSTALIAQIMAQSVQSHAELMQSIARRYQEELRRRFTGFEFALAPDLYTILSTRLQSSMMGLKKTLELQREHRSTFTPRRGYYGRFLVAEDAEQDEKATSPSDAS
ncbi:Mediator of RNA polymerase II transcription subunit 6 [Malassezia vespertilionis]|uniref:Mediator of RNA polymerase II transcription subunit 6 n=1 Tax=Malassezia vespertilionis TaxID=2020962 RepID=UPI0024B03D8F|nr:Mediator of RNA polymerase II transcription subunit 6 [Malassezia vespertilionis]WFD07669.1 Mediator of RNA polymerase II transcription subunit 6 [Malassezia vespertilionis]